MEALFPQSTVAVVQASPHLFDRAATLNKSLELINRAGGRSQLILFPEAFIPAYPRGFRFGMVVGRRSNEGRQIWQRYWANAVEVPGPATELLGKAAAEAGAYVAMGVVEREGRSSRGTLYCTMLYFGPDGRMLGKHRKLKPTGAERLIWGEGDGSTLTVLDTPLGKVGGLICWENYMPLARMSMYAKGVEIYLAPTADSRDTWQATLRHIAREGRCYVLGCNQYVSPEMYPTELLDLDSISDTSLLTCRGGSAIISPLGEVIAGPLYDEEGILYAELDLSEVVRSKLDFDVVGHYSRPDVFHFSVNELPAHSVRRDEG